MTDNPTQADDSETGAEADGVSETERAAEKEFDKAQTQSTQTLSESDKYVLELKEQRARETEKTKLTAAVKSLQETDGLKAVHPEILEGALHRKAAADPAFKQAFYDQDKNPGAWKGQLDTLAGDVAEKMKPNDKATEDLEAANASVRGDSTEAPNKDNSKDEKSNAEVEDMSDTAFHSYVHNDSRY